MEEFIKAFIEIDNEILDDILYKLKKSRKLEIWEEEYLITWYKLIERYKKNETETKT